MNTCKHRRCNVCACIIVLRISQTSWQILKTNYKIESEGFHNGNERIISIYNKLKSLVSVETEVSRQECHFMFLIPGSQTLYS